VAGRRRGCSPRRHASWGDGVFGWSSQASRTRASGTARRQASQGRLESGDLGWTMNEAAAVEDPAQARLERPVKAVSFGLKLRIGPKSLGQFTLASSPGRPLFAWRVFPRKHNYHGRRASRLAATPVCPNQRWRPQFACLIGGRLRDR